MEGIFDTLVIEDDTTGRKIGSLDKLHQFINSNIRIIDSSHRAIDHFAEVVWQHISGHTYRNTGSTVDQEVWNTCGKYGWLLQGIVEVEREINGIFVDIGQHFVTDPAQAGLGITHRGGAIAVHTTKVTLAIDQGIT